MCVPTLNYTATNASNGLEDLYPQTGVVG